MNGFTVDSHAWLAYLDEKEPLKPLIENNQLQTPASVVCEVTNALRRRGIPMQKLSEVLEFIQQRSLILQLDFEKAVKAGNIRFTERMHQGDAMVYAYASKEWPVLTGDPDFKGKPNVQFID